MWRSARPASESPKPDMDVKVPTSRHSRTLDTAPSPIFTGARILDQSFRLFAPMMLPAQRSEAFYRSGASQLPQ